LNITVEIITYEISYNTFDKYSKPLSKIHKKASFKPQE